MLPVFSVSMCVYGKDNPVHFKQAVDSVLNQTVKPTEVVLVVDGPVPDELDVIIKKYEANSVVKAIRLSQNMGHGVARRTGLDNCSNDLVALMDADDLSMGNRFELQLKKFNEQPNLDIVGGNISEFIDNPENIVGKRIVPEYDDEIKLYLKKRCPMNQVTVMFKKASVQKVGGYIDWFCNEDYYLWIRMTLANMKFANVPEILVNVRVGKDMYKRRGGWKYFKSEARIQWLLLQKNLVSYPRYFYNILLRLCLQVLMPNWLRGFVFKSFAREND